MSVSASDSFNINDIRVAKPCPVSWDSMRGDDRTRNCDECALTVYNIAGMTTAEAASLIVGREDRLCVRLHRRLDGTVVTRDCPKGLAAYRKRVGKIVGSAFAAFIGLFTAAPAQMVSLNDSQGTVTESFVEVPMVQGVVKDANGAVIADARIEIITSDGRTLVKKADRQGRFKIVANSLLAGRDSITIDALGFRPFKDDFSIRRRQMIDYDVMLQVGVMVGIVEITRPPAIDMQSSGVTTTIRRNDY